jgi:CubicO group peptidase (beta-lactamase class C family)
MARFGLLILAGGAWNGEQILPRDWVIDVHSRSRRSEALTSRGIA